MSASMLPIPPNIAEIAAPMLLGICFNFCLYGILVAQVYSYHYNFADDRIAIKTLVYSVLLLESTQTAFAGVDVVYWYAAGFGNVARLQDTYLTPFDTPFMGALIAFIVQVFYSYRIWVLRPALVWLSSLVVLISLTQAVAGCVAAGYIHHIRFSQVHSAEASILGYTWYIGAATADLLVAVTMVWLLSTSQRFYSSRVLSRLMRLCVETNVASATVALLALVLYVSFPGKTYVFGIGACIGKIYSNTLLVSLNNRIALRDAQSNGTRTFVHSEIAFQRSRLQADSHASNHAVILQPDPAESEAEIPFKTPSLRVPTEGDDIELSNVHFHREK